MKERILICQKERQATTFLTFMQDQAKAFKEGNMAVEATAFLVAALAHDVPFVSGLFLHATQEEILKSTKRKWLRFEDAS